MIVVQRQQEELFLEHPVFDAQGRLPFQYKTLYEYQQEDTRIQALPTTQPHHYQMKIWAVMDWFVITKGSTIVSV